jgi:hypothetical protein
MKGKAMPIREQNSGFVQKNQSPRHLTPRTQQQMIAAARRQAQYEASTQDEEYDDDLEEDQRYYETRLPTSVRRYQPIPDVLTKQGNVKVVAHYHDQPLRAHRLPPRQKEIYTDEVEIPLATGKKQIWSGHPLLYLGVGMIATLALMVLIFSSWNWIQIKKDDLTYGTPRTFQIDSVVGHNDSPANPSHFTAINLNRHVEVIEWPGQDSSKMKVYQITTLFGDGEDLTPVTLSFADLTGDGKPDMLIHIQNTVIAMINDHGSFRPARPGEVKGLL